MQEYPQIFDLIKKGSAAKPAELDNEIFHKYKVDQLKGLARQQFEETERIKKKIKRKFNVFTIIFLFVLSALFAFYFVFFEEFFETLGSLLFICALFFLGILILLITLFLTIKKKSAYLRLKETEIDELEKLAAAQFNISSNAVTVEFFQRICNKHGKANKWNECKSFRAYKKDNFVFIVYLPYLLKIPIKDCLSAEEIQGKIHFRNNLTFADRRTESLDTFNFSAFSLRHLQTVKSQGIKIYGNKSGSLLFLAKRYGQLLFQSKGEFWTLNVLPYSYVAAKQLFKE